MTQCLSKTVCRTQRYTYKEAETYEVGRVVASHSGTTVEHNEEDEESGATTVDTVTGWRLCKV